MSKTYYECHITMVGNVDIIRPKVLSRTSWKFSAIEGDIALGSGLKCYATTHFNARSSQEDVLKALNDTADLLQASDIKVIRRKVELVIYDDRSTKVQPGTCEGSCVACHLDDYVERDQKTLLLNQMVDAWEVLPGGRDYTTKVAEKWMNTALVGAINNIRGYLKRPKPNGDLPPNPFA